VSKSTRVKGKMTSHLLVVKSKLGSGLISSKSYLDAKFQLSIAFKLREESEVTYRGHKAQRHSPALPHLAWKTISQFSAPLQNFKNHHLFFT